MENRKVVNFIIVVPFLQVNLMHKSWIRPTLEYGNILYSGAALSHLQHLDNLQVQIEHTCCLTCQPLLHCRNAAII